MKFSFCSLFSSNYLQLLSNRYSNYSDLEDEVRKGLADYVRHLAIAEFVQYHFLLCSMNVFAIEQVHVVLLSVKSQKVGS